MIAGQDHRRTNCNEHQAETTLEWQSAISDTVVETHDRIVGKTWREAKTLCDVRITDAKGALHDTLRAFSGLGAALLEARGLKRAATALPLKRRLPRRADGTISKALSLLPCD